MATAEELELDHLRKRVEKLEARLGMSQTCDRDTGSFICGKPAGHEGICWPMPEPRPQYVKCFCGEWFLQVNEQFGIEKRKYGNITHRRGECIATPYDEEAVSADTTSWKQRALAAEDAIKAVRDMKDQVVFMPAGVGDLGSYNRGFHDTYRIALNVINTALGKNDQ